MPNNFYQHHIKNLFTYQDIQDGCPKRVEKLGTKLLQDILTFEQHYKRYDWL